VTIKQQMHIADRLIVGHVDKTAEEAE